MELTKEQAEKLVADVQVAHRLLVAYYQRLLARLDLLARELDLDFWEWEPAENARPCRGTTQPGRKWLWDMLPLFASNHSYRRMRSETLNKGDTVVIFSPYADDAYHSDNCGPVGITGPDPLKLPFGNGVLYVELYRCVKSSKGTWSSALDEVESPDYELNGWQDVGLGLRACAFEFELAQLMRTPEALLNRVRSLLDTPLLN